MGKEERRPGANDRAIVPQEVVDQYREIIAQGGDAAVRHVAGQVSEYLKRGADELRSTARLMRTVITVDDGSPLPPIREHHLNLVFQSRGDTRVRQIEAFISRSKTAMKAVKLLMQVRNYDEKQLLEFANKVLDHTERKPAPPPSAAPVRSGFWSRFRGGNERVAEPEPSEPEVDPLEAVFKALSEASLLAAYLEIAVFAAEAVILTDKDLTEALGELGEHKQKGLDLVEEVRRSAAGFREGAMTQKQLAEERARFESISEGLDLREDVESLEQARRVEQAIELMAQELGLDHQTSENSIRMWQEKYRIVRVVEGKDQLGAYHKCLETEIHLCIQKYVVAVTLMIHTMEALAGIIQAGLLQLGAINLLQLQQTAELGLVALAETGEQILKSLADGLSDFKETGSLMARQQSEQSRLKAGDRSTGEDVIDGEFAVK